MARQNSTDKRILLISAHSFQGIESFDWSQDLPNISDYDVVILDIPRIFTLCSLGGKLKHLDNNRYLLPEEEEYKLLEKVKPNLSYVRTKLLEMLEFGVTIYALYVPNLRVFTSKELPRYGEDIVTTARVSESGQQRFQLLLDTDEWCPIDIRTVAEEGETIVVKSSAYQEYFRDFKRWHYYFQPDLAKIHRLFKDTFRDTWKVSHQINIIATNKVKKPVAIEFIPLFHEPDPDLDEWSSEPSQRGGNLVLLPVIDMHNTAPHIEVLLRQTKEITETPPPSWVDTVEIPGEAALKGEVATSTQALREAEARVKESEARLDELQNYKKLLYETGLPLQERVKLTFEALGATTKPSVVTDEFIISIEGKDALVEVKGVGKSITKDDIGQLIIDKGEHIKATGHDVKGILVGNAWRCLPPEQRDSRGKPIFPDPIVAIAQNHDIGLISTVQLFRAFCKIREEPQQKKEILKKVITGRGIITLQ